jgi:probable rRNA maturation factor
MPVLITRQAPASPALPVAALKRSAQRMLDELKISNAELSILLCDDAQIQTLNFTHRGKNSPTDVLSFPLMDPEDEQLSTLDGGALGDVVISLDTAQRQAAHRGQDLMQEVEFLLAHGLLHLLGYDHETDQEEAEMDAATRKLVAALERRTAKPKTTTRRTSPRRTR